MARNATSNTPVFCPGYWPGWRSTHPTLVTYGARDLAIHPSASRMTASRIPGAEAVVFKTGHVHHWEELETFNRTVEEWLA